MDLGALGTLFAPTRNVQGCPPLQAGLATCVAFVLWVGGEGPRLPAGLATCVALVLRAGGQGPPLCPCATAASGLPSLRWTARTSTPARARPR